MRDECLNLQVFTSLAEAWVRLSAFRQHSTTARPHSQVGYLAPLVFKAAWLEAQAKVQDPYHGHLTSSSVSCQIAKIENNIPSSDSDAFEHPYVTEKDIAAVINNWQNLDLPIVISLRCHAKSSLP